MNPFSCLSRWRLLIGVSAALVLLSTTTRGLESDGDLQKLVKAVEQEFISKKPANDSAAISRGDAGRMMVAQLRSAISSGNAAAIETVLIQLSAITTSEILRQQCNDLVTKIHSEREKKEQKVVDEINAVFKRAGEAMRSAKKPADLDVVLRDIAQLRNRGNEQQSSITVSNALNKVEPAFQFVSRWQDYLSATASGNARAAAEVLGRLAGDSNTNQPDLIPRSEILARIQAFKLATRDYSEDYPKSAESNDKLTVPKPLTYDPATRTLSFSIKKLDELDSAINALEDLKNKPEFRSFKVSIDNQLKKLRPLQSAYMQLKAGLATKLELPSSNARMTTSLEIETIPLRAELVLLALPRYLGLPRESKPNPGEGPYDFLGRISSEAVTHGDYLLASRARETQQLLRERKTTDHGETAQAQFFVAAHNQEIAGQYALAVASYQKALACGVDIVPPKIIGERLAEIKAKHPEEYQKGVDFYLSPPKSRYSSGNPQGWHPVKSQQPETTAMEEIAVPAVNPSPTPSATLPTE